MDMGTTTTAMSMMSTATSAATSTSSAMSMSMDGSDCKISMLWNWYTVDACFLSNSWHITSHGMFAGSCIGVILLVMVLELLRRTAKEYDAYLIRSRSRAAGRQVSTLNTNASDNSVHKANGNGNGNAAPSGVTTFSPNVYEQAIRAALHMFQFANAYMIMLLAMYFNGYIIICIFIGAFLGYFVFGWGRMALQSEEREVTFCCG